MTEIFELVLQNSSVQRRRGALETAFSSKSRHLSTVGQSFFSQKQIEILAKIVNITYMHLRILTKQTPLFMSTRGKGEGSISASLIFFKTLKSRLACMDMIILC
jgi:hypothetical protein